MHQVEDCVLKDQEELRNVEKKVLKEEEDCKRWKSQWKRKTRVYQVEDFILQRDETVKKLGESNQSQQEPYTTATSGSDQRFRSQQPNIGNTLAQDLALIPKLDRNLQIANIQNLKQNYDHHHQDFQYKIQLTDHTQIYSKPYKCNQEEQALIRISSMKIRSRRFGTSSN